MHEIDCRNCGGEGIMNERGLCPLCESLAEIARNNLEGAARSKRQPPKKCPPCETCGGPTCPVLLNPTGKWQFICSTGLQCRWCLECRKEHRCDEPCPREGLTSSSLLQ